MANGKANGPYKAYDEAGKLTMEGIAQNGKKNGKWIEYYPSGRKSMEEKYNQGELVWGLYYNENGSLNSAFDGLEEVTGHKLLEWHIYQMLVHIRNGNSGKGGFVFDPTAYYHPSNDVSQLFYDLIQLTDAKDPIARFKAQLSEAQAKYGQREYSQAMKLLEGIINP